MNPGLPFFFFNARWGFKFLDGYETFHSTKWWSKYFYVKHLSGTWNIPMFFRRDKFQALKLRRILAWMESVRPLQFTVERDVGEGSEFDEEGVETIIPLIGTWAIGTL